MNLQDYRSSLALPVIAPNFNNLLDQLQSHEAGYRYLEVWLDYLPPLSIPRLKQLAQAYGERLVVLFRRKELEPTQASIADVVQTLQQLTPVGAWADFDLRTQEDLLNTVQKRVALRRVVLSYHNYQQTPEDEVLHEQVARLTNAAAQFPETVIKLACFCQSDKDALRLVRLMATMHARGIPRFCVSGMGDFGKIVKFAGLTMGNFFTFAPAIASKASAPGQYTQDELSSLLSILYA